MNFHSNINPNNIFLPKSPPPLPSTQNRPSLPVKSTPSPLSRTAEQKSRPTTTEINAITYKQVTQATTLATKCCANLVTKAGLRTFNTNADALKATEGWKDRIATQVSCMSVSDQKKLASMSMYDLVDHDREVVGHILNCLSESKDLNEATKTNLNHKVAELKTVIINIEEKEPDYKYLGGGAVNKVYRVTYTDENGQQATGVFKPDPAGLDTLTQTKEKLFGTAQASGIPEGDEGHLTARSVGSYALDKALYGDNPIGVKTDYVIVNGKRGILMELASGASPEPTKMKDREITKNELQEKGITELIQKDGKIIPNWQKVLEKTMGAQNLRLENGKLFGTLPEFNVGKDSKWLVNEKSDMHKLTMETITEFGGYENLSADDKKLISHELKAKDFTVENGRLFIIRPETPIKPENPVTADGLLKLQVFDWISGQVDRHPGNYYIDPKNGQVMAIDNDCSFGVNSVPKGVDVRSQPRLGMVVPNMGSLMLRMPTVVTESVKKDIMDLYNDPAKLKATLGQYISEEETGATIRRLIMLAKHVDSDQCKVVANAEDLYKPENLLLQDSNNSLYLRERDRYRSKSWNDLRKN